ncbi:MAG: nitrophenyl compound nitroreductase subunit ArsF family protein [Candidatus Kapabacteria bacterium]|nr:nitrophenyl compound nitroreductase subunit ArsF family protein [Candidatus Kapabacteria bacterium]
MRKFIFSISIFFLLFAFSSSINAQEKKVRIDVLYFHATTRCHGCLTIEEYIKNSMNAVFSIEMKDSLIVSSSIDFQQTENEHFQDDYKFESQTLILSKKVNGKEVKWKNLDKIWDYSSDYQKFQKYIEDEINKFIKES